MFSFSSFFYLSKEERFPPQFAINPLVTAIEPGLKTDPSRSCLGFDSSTSCSKILCYIWCRKPAFSSLVSFVALFHLQLPQAEIQVLLFLRPGCSRDRIRTHPFVPAPVARPTGSARGNVWHFLSKGRFVGGFLIGLKRTFDPFEPVSSWVRWIEPVEISISLSITSVFHGQVVTWL